MEPWAYEGPFERSMSRLRSYLEINGAKVGYMRCSCQSRPGWDVPAITQYTSLDNIAMDGRGLEL